MIDSTLSVCHMT